MSFLRGFFSLLCWFAIAQSFSADKFTCKHNKSAKKHEWNSCTRKNSAKYPAIHTTFEEEIRANTMDDVWLKQLPNDFHCFSVRMYALTSASEPQCPAVCKLRDSDEKKDEACSHNDHMAVSESVARISSPRFECGLGYRTKEICLYNVTLSCETDDVVISRDLSQLHLADGDFLDVIDYSKEQSFQTITGSEFPTERDMRIGTSDFVVLFYSSSGEKSDENNFSLHMECLSGPRNSKEENDTEEQVTSGLSQG